MQRERSEEMGWGGRESGNVSGGGGGTRKKEGKGDRARKCIDHVTLSLRVLARR